MFDVGLTEKTIEPADEYRLFEQAVAGENAGAIVMFSGVARHDDGVESLFLEHYQSLTASALEQLMAEAQQRFPLLAARVVHRVGDIQPPETIVVVLCACEHRQAAFEAASFLMDQLKTRVPLWKKETRNNKGQWVEQKQADVQAGLRWGTAGQVDSNDQ